MGDLEQLKRMLKERLNEKMHATAEICWDAVRDAAISYDDALYANTKATAHATPDKTDTNEVVAELQTISNSFLKIHRSLGHLTGEAWKAVDSGMLPKADMTIEDWGAEKREVLRCWFDEDGGRLQELRLIGEAFAMLAGHTAKQTQPPNGRRLRSGPEYSSPVHMLLYAILEAVHSKCKAKTHAKQIADVVHQWATGDADSNVLSERAWRRIQSMFKRSPKACAALLPESLD